MDVKCGERVVCRDGRIGEVCATSGRDMTCLVRFFNYDLRWVAMESVRKVL